MNGEFMMEKSMKKMDGTMRYPNSRKPQMFKKQRRNTWLGKSSNVGP